MTAAELQDVIDQFGLTVERMAQHLGIGLRTLYRYLSGKRAIPKTVAVAIKQQQELRRIRTLIAVGGDLIW